MKDLTDPTNRDSVPAMLTPGEYVLNKEATEMYGPIIEQMNENGLAARAEGNMEVLSLNTGGSSLRPKARPDKFKPYDLQEGIIETAKVLKISPLDLATVISYETAGTFDPLRKGPVTKHGMHKGLIQFGTGSKDGSVAKGSIADEFDVEFNTKNSSLRSQLGYMGEDGNWVPGAIVKHSLARGFKPGEHGILDLYSSINAGGVGPEAHGKTDEFAGGMPGTVFQKLNTMYEDVGNITHLDRAKALFPGWMDKGMDHYLPPIITTNETGAVETSINPKSRPTFTEIPQQVQPSPMLEVPPMEQPIGGTVGFTPIDNAVREAMRFDPAVDIQTRHSPQLQPVPTDAPSAPTDMEIPYYQGDISTPEANVLPDNSQVIKLYGSNPELRNELYSVNSTYPLEEVPAKEADDGFSLFDSISNAAANAWYSLMPRRSTMHVVPSVAGDVQQDLYHRDPSQYIGGMRELFNQGGPVQHLNPGGRAGGKKKVWDSLTQTYIWVGKDDPRYVNSAATPNIPVRPGQNQDLVPAEPYTYDVRPRTNSLSDLTNRFNVTTPRSDLDVPPIVDAAPVPMSDEAILNTSSQVVEQREDDYPSNAQPGWRNLREGGQWQNPQAVPAPSPENIPMLDEDEANRLKYNAQLREYARQFPEGDPRRIEAFNNVLHEKGAAHPSYVSDRPIESGLAAQAPPIVSTPEKTVVAQDPAEVERLRQNELLGDYARQFPKGDPRRAEAFNRQLHQKGAVHPLLPPDFDVYDASTIPLLQAPDLPGGVMNTDIDPNSIVDTWVNPKGQTYLVDKDGILIDPISSAAAHMFDQSLYSAQAGKQDAEVNLAQLNDQAKVSLEQTGGVPQDLINEIDQEKARLDSMDVLLDNASSSIAENLILQQEDLDEAYESYAQQSERFGTPVLTKDQWLQTQTAEDIATIDTTSIDVPEVTGTKEEEVSAGSQEATTTVADKVASNNEPAINTPVETASKVGADAIANNPAEESKAMSTIRGFFGDLFTADELKRAAVLFIGAMLTGATPGQALAFAGKDYLSRGEAHDKYVKELMEEGDHTTASIKAYSKSKNLGDLVPKQAMRSGTGDYKDVWRPDGKRVRAMEVSLGPNNNIWVNAATGLKIPDTWEDDPKRIPNTPESDAAIIAAGKSYGEMVNELQRTNASIEGSNDTLTGLSPNLEGGKIAKWARDNNIDASEMPTIIENAYMDLLQDVERGGKVAKDLRPYLNNQYVTAKSGSYSELFTLTVGDNAGQSMSAEKISEVLISARNITSKSDDPLVKNRGDVEIIKAVIQEWEKLVDKSKYKASSTETPFFKFLKEQISG